MTHNYNPSSEVGWIDFSDRDKQKVMKVIEMLQPEGTVDELGIGIIRNAMSDAMFPGITTIMTRAKYFFIVPRILHTYMSQRQIKMSAQEYLRLEENEIMETLAKKYEFNENEKIIGVSIAKLNQGVSARRKKELIRKPSTIYWNGLRSYKIYIGEQSLSNLLTKISGKSSSSIGYLPSEGETSDDRDASNPEKYIFNLPDFSPNWKSDLSISLTQMEADFLKHRIVDNFPDRLLSHVLLHKAARNEFMKARNFIEFAQMPFVNSLPLRIKQVIDTAYGFWKIFYGAHLRFNILLHNKYGSLEFVGERKNEWKEWVEEMRGFNWNAFNKELLWQTTKSNSKVKGFTERFVNSWIEEIQAGNFNESKLDKLVEEQEKRNKTHRSKLRANNDERYKGWIGIQNMDFRFGNAITILRDINSPR